MQIVTTKASTKVAAVATALAMASSMLSFAPMVHAETAAACSVGTVDLTVGSTGDAVKCLQAALVSGGYLVMPAGVMPGYFGQLTKSAVMKWQVAKGITPAAGYFGPISRGKFSPATGGDTGTGTGTGTGTQAGDLEGTDGTIDDVNELGSYNNEDVGEGQDGVKVLGAEVVASNDGDIALKSVKVSFDSTGNTGSDNLDDYINGVSIMLGNEKIGSADVEDFNESGTEFSKVITLSGKTTIKADDSENLYVAVDAANTFDSSDISGDSWTVNVENIRFIDGSGVYTTDSTAGDLPDLDVPVDFVSFSTAADTELRISKDSDSPEQSIVVIDDTSDTENVTLLKGKLKLDGTSDAVLDELPVTLTTVGGANVTAVTGSVTLKIDGEEYSETVSISGSTTGTVTFDNLDFAIDAGDTVEFEVLADINDIDAGNLDEGDTLKAEVTATNRDYIDIENEEGDQLSDSTEKSGTALGDYQELRTQGIGLTLVSTATDVTTGTTAGDDIGLFTIRFKLTAIGNTVYVSSLADAVTGATPTTGKTSILIDRAGTATSTNISVALVNITDATLDAASAGLYGIDEGESETFEVTASVPMNSTTTGQHRMSLVGTSWGTSSTDATPDNAYTSNLSTFKTSYKVLN